MRCPYCDHKVYGPDAPAVLEAHIRIRHRNRNVR